MLLGSNEFAILYKFWEKKDFQKGIVIFVNPERLEDIINLLILDLGVE